MLALVARVRELTAEVESVRTECVLLQAEISNRWGKFAQACSFLGFHVRGKRAARSRTITSVEEVDREIRRVVLDCLEDENSVEHALPVPSEHSAPTADAGADAARRTAEAEVYEQCATELVPFVIIARDKTLPAVEHAIAPWASS
jgi:hypothetical protein